ncbi:MAG: ABC transporter substrate-binding protein [Actinobacteria bacterium]|nr:ABC transporter substrate-binding protein [Actinomycetota bacterium]
MKNTSRAARAAAGVALAVALAGCSGTAPSASNSDSAGASSGGDYILGTTDTVTALDPAGAYDIGSWNLQYAMFQQLVVIPANGATEAPDAASACTYGDAKTVTCTLNAGLKFSNGHDLTSSDVKFSFERNLKIAAPNGASVLLGSLDTIDTPDATTVVFHLKQADLTFIKVLTTAAASIVDEEVYPADKLLDDSQVVGSGPLMLESYTAGDQAVFKANPNYTGDRKAQASQVFVKYYKDSSPLRQAVENNEVDVAWRDLTPTDYADLTSKGALDVIQGNGSSFRYWVWQFGTDVGKQKAIRQAAAYLIDREAIAKDAYDGTVTPSYSIVPAGFAGQKDSFKDAYGAAPDAAKAKQVLADAGIQTPVKITIGYTPTHYGPNAVDEANLLSEQLKASGLFDPKTESAEWTQYQTLYKQKAYDLFMLGWYPDFLDADNYLTPFLVDGGFFKNGYSNSKVNELVKQEQGETDTAKRDARIGELQDITAADVPLIPSWNGKNVAVSSKSMSGVKDTLDPTYIFRLWAISKKG